MGLLGPREVQSANGAEAQEANALESIEQQKLDELKAAIGPLSGRAQIFCTDDCFRRYLRARNWNVKKAEKMLRDTLSWREKFKPEEIRWDDVGTEKEVGRVYRTHFHDKLGRTVVVMCPGKQSTVDHDGQIKYLVYNLENAIMGLGPKAEKMVWFIDFRNFSLSRCPPMKTSLETVSILQNHYPERLGLAILYDPPSLFLTAFKMIKPFIDPVTYQKLKFIQPDQPDTAEVLKDVFDAKLLEEPFSGHSAWDFNYEKHSALMCEDDAKADAFWGVSH